MQVNLLNSIIQFRLAVGYLGERSQYGWWQSSFFTLGSGAFLSPLFGRTQLLAQCSGITRAAALVHDERIGVGRVYHLFRLPEDVEQSIHQVLQTTTSGNSFEKLTASKETALAFLRTNTKPFAAGGVGPLRIGSLADLQNLQTWKSVAGAYLFGFETKQEIFPYFTELV